MFSFGSDPEIFLALNGKIVNAIGILPPKSQKISRGVSSIYYDNALAEMQVEPSHTAAEAIENIRKAMALLQDTLPRHEIRIQSAHWFQRSDIDNEESRSVGCNSEYCAYTLEQIMPPQDVIKNTSFRTAGGHIHLGDNELFHDGHGIINTVRMLDLFLGIPSLLLDNDNTQRYRRRIYGHAGSHRVPDHGLEYRCIGNFWLRSPRLVEVVYDLTDFAINFVENNGYSQYWSQPNEDDESSDQSKLCFGYDARLLRSCINSCDKRKASKFMQIVSRHIPTELNQRIHKLSTINFDIYSEWGIPCLDS